MEKFYISSLELPINNFISFTDLMIVNDLVWFGFEACTLSFQRSERLSPSIHFYMVVEKTLATFNTYPLNGQKPNSKRVEPKIHY